MHTVHGGLPYEHMTIWMIIDIGKYLVRMINAFPTNSGISRNYRPHIIMTGNQIESKNHNQRPFGAYVQVHNDRNVTNKIIDMNQGTIYLVPTGNLQGMYKFLSLCTGRKITRIQFT